MFRNFKWFRKLVGGVWVKRTMLGDWQHVRPLDRWHTDPVKSIRLFTVPGYSEPLGLHTAALALGWQIENYSGVSLTAKHILPN